MTTFEVWPSTAETANGIELRDLVPSLRSLLVGGLLPGSIDVRIHAGRYELEHPLIFGPDDLGSELTPIRIRAAGDGDVVFSGGRRLTAPVGEDGIAVFDLTTEAAITGSSVIRHAYANGQRLHAARYPKHDPNNPYFGGWMYADPLPEGTEPAKDRFWCRDSRLRQWGGLIGAEVNVFPRHCYRNCQRRIVGFDPSTGEIRIDPPSFYEIDPGDRFFIQYLPDELSAPGEWIHDPAQQEIRLIPLGSPLAGDTVEIELPLIPNLIHINGAAAPVAPLSVDGWAFWDDTIRHLPVPDDVTAGFVTFEGITFECCTGTAIRIENARQCSIVASNVRHAGGRGVELIGGAECRLIDCEVTGTSWDGVLICAGTHKPFNVVEYSAGHRVENCYIHHIGIDEKHVAGVSIAGVGNELAHTLIHDCPRWGILSRGSLHLIEYNHVRHVNIETADTGGINTCDRDLTLMGTVIRYNQVHDILGFEKIEGGWRFPSYAFGIYLDDWTSHVTVHGNLTYNTPRGGIYLNSGQGNIVTNNSCLAGRRELAYYNRWSADLERTRLGTYDQGLRRNQIEGNIFYGAGETDVLYCFGRNLSASGEVDIATNTWARNIIWNDNRPFVIRANNGNESRDYVWQEWQELGQDQGSLIFDPCLVDPDNGEFDLAADSLAIEFGFEPLPISEMGPQPSANRPNWPPGEVAGIRETMARELNAVGHAS